MGLSDKLKTMLITDDDRENIARTSFTPETQEIFLVFTVEELPPGTTLKSVWTARGTDFETVDATQSAANRRRDSLSVVRPKDGWPVGSYQVDLYIGEEIAGSGEFVIAEETEARLIKPPAYIILTDELGERTPKDKFPTSADEILFIVATDHLEKGAPVTSVWIAEKADQLDPNELVDKSVMPAPGPERDSLFIFTPPQGGFHPGRYRVDLYIEDQRIATKPFRITE